MNQVQTALPKKSNFFLKAVILAFICFCVLTLAAQQLRFTELREKESALNDEIASLEADIEDIEADLARPFDDEYVKKVARAKLNYHLPEEIIYYNDLER